MANCKIYEEYFWIECSLPEWDDDGLCILHSRRKDKDEGGEFTKALKAKLKGEDYDFSIVYFPGHFDLHLFTGEEKFTFSKPVDFSRAIFTRGVNFSFATFKDTADFFETTFTEEVYFRWATFGEGTDFSFANFEGKVHFTGTILLG
jgi:hypothetical protein